MRFYNDTVMKIHQTIIGPLSISKSQEPIEILIEWRSISEDHKDEDDAWLEGKILEDIEEYLKQEEIRAVSPTVSDIKLQLDLWLDLRYDSMLTEYGIKLYDIDYHILSEL